MRKDSGGQQEQSGDEMDGLAGGGRMDDEKCEGVQMLLPALASTNGKAHLLGKAGPRRRSSSLFPLIGSAPILPIQASETARRNCGRCNAIGAVRTGGCRCSVC